MRKIPCWIRKTLRYMAICTLWRFRDRPGCMFQNGRPTLTHLAPNDEFVFRVFSDWLDGNELKRDQIPPCPDFSVNHIKNDGKWWHVLLPDPAPKQPESPEEKKRRRRALCTGVVGFRGIPSRCEFSGIQYRFVVEHDPLEHNYCHCEVRIYENAKRLSRSDIDGLKANGKKIKKHYRNEMFYEAKVILAAEVSTNAKASAKT